MSARSRALAQHRNGELTAAERAYRTILASCPDDGLTWHYLAVLCGQRGEHSAVIDHCQNALAGGYRSISVYANLARALKSEGRFFEAAEAASEGLAQSEIDLDTALQLIDLLRHGGFERSAFNALRGLAPDQGGSVEVKALLAESAIQIGAAADAQRALSDLIAIEPNSVAHYFNLAFLHFMMGKASKCEQLVRQAIAIDPHFFPPWYLLSQAAQIDAGDPLFADLLVRARSHPGSESPVLQFAAARILDSQGEVDQAFEFYRRGNRLARSQFHYEVSNDEGAMAQLADLLQKKHAILPVGSIEPLVSNELRPIFIVGMPRTGSTLLESRLLRHPAVGSAGELVWFQRLIRDALNDEQLPFPEGMWQLTAEALMSLRYRYLKMLRENMPDEKSDITHCIDKLPANLLYFPLIRRLFPAATVLITRRNPAATSLSCYMQLFSGSQHFAYDLAETARYWRAQHKLTEAVLSLNVPGTAVVELSAMQQKQSAELRRILRLCGLPESVEMGGDPSERPLLRTASALQVRQREVDSESAVQRYHEHLGPLRELIQQWPEYSRTDSQP